MGSCCLTQLVLCDNLEGWDGVGLWGEVREEGDICALLVLLLLSHFNRVRLCATPWTAANEAPLSLGFSRGEYWSGLPFPSPGHVYTYGCFTLYGRSQHGILK